MTASNRRAAGSARRLAAGALVAVLLGAGTARASTLGSPQDLQAAKARLSALNAQLALFVQRHDAASLKLKQTQSQLAGARSDATRAASQAAAAAADLNARARMAYETGGTSNVVAVLQFSTIDQASVGVQFLSTLAQGDADAGMRAQVARRQATTTASRLRSLLAEQQRLLRGMDAARTQITTAISAQAQAIDRIERQTRRPLSQPVTDPSGSGSGGGIGGGGGFPPPPPEAEIDALIYSIWGNGKQGHTAECIADRESGDNPYSRSPSGAAGLFQLMPFWWDGANQYGWKFDPYDAQENASHAYLIWKSSGWGAWGRPC